MIVRDACPACGSTRFKKNGHTHNHSISFGRVPPRRKVDGSGRASHPAVAASGLVNGPRHFLTQAGLGLVA